MAQQFVVFQLNNEEYALPVHAVREITKLTDITPVPHSPAYVKGIINLRGIAMPVIDIHRRLEIPRSHCTLGLIAEVNGNPLCLAVNEVKEVSVLGDIQPPPQIVTSNFIVGIVNLPDRLVMMLRLDSIVSDEECQALAVLA
jgi:purine-binding chemotaxis protein CheW